MWRVKNLLLVPSFAFPPSAIIKRLVAPKRNEGGKPLAATARRAGWVGCNLDLHRIAPEARIFLVQTVASARRRTGVAPVSDLKNTEDGDRQDACPTVIVPPEEVRARYTRLKPIREIKTAQRGWTLDVLNIVRRLGKTEITNYEVYAHDRELEQLHPDNRHVKDKIRQQLQVLRDTGLLIHVERGIWRLP